jgi:outer membrane protein assembly factor BamB
VDGYGFPDVRWKVGDPVTSRHGRWGLVAAACALVNACAACAPGIRAAPAYQERGWREYLGSAARAASSGEALGGDPQPVWRTHVGRGIVGAPAMGEDVVAVALVDRQVALLDRHTGELFWRHRLGQHVGAGPLLADDRLVVATQDDRGEVYALRLTDGRQLWSRAVGDVAAPLALAGDVVYAGTLAGDVVALQLSQGGRHWRTQVSGAVRAAPVVTEQGLVVATTTDSLFVLARTDGRIMRRRPVRGTVLAAPALAEGRLVIGTAGGRLEALDPATLAPHWTLDLDGAVLGHIAVRSGRVYALTAAGTLWIVGLADGGAPHRLRSGLVSRAGPTPTNGQVLLTGVTGELVLLDSDGRRRWSTRLGAAVYEPALVEGRTIIAVSRRGEVVAFR